jgi:ribonuclease J
MSSERMVTVLPLGGLGEIGLNCMLLSTPGSAAVIDCGLMFPDELLLGVDVVIPSFEPILAQAGKVKGIVLTHGHEDHIGALPWILPRLKVPVYGSRFTLGLVENKLREHFLDDKVDLRPVAAGDTVVLGDFTFHFFPVCHSIIEGFALGVETPVGRMVHTGDFKIDQNPLDGHATDLPAIRDFCGPGVKLLCSDSTNVEREGFALTEREIKATLSDIFAQAKGRILITLFSSHIQRMQEIVDLAALHGRKVGVSGKSLSKNIDLARDMGLLRAPDGVLRGNVEDMAGLEDREMVLLVTGSQGEPLAALSRIAMEEHRFIAVRPGDLVIMSSRFIPGNVKAITRVINRLYKLGAEVLYERVQAIHASGHAHKEELRMMLDAVNPEHFIPVHGEYRHLVKHGRLAVEQGVAPDKVIVTEDGGAVTFFEDGFRVEEPRPEEPIYVDGKGVGDVGQSVLKERRLLGGEGMVIVIMVVDQDTGEITHGPDVVSKGFVFEQHYAHVLEDAKCLILDIYESMPQGDAKKLKERIRSSLRRFFRKVLDRDPVVVPLVLSL